ncbi:hypothetical protein Acsp04_42330 [Actinomadura sp. NBRC 104425]|uniref:DUF397 domain-containing protein n=1 Tax=Actinomadura sp. NBRC 104425 TaxID=3032204 RepID=UPI0024A425A2|nr:DUF397 domain-containing protein [Actinomadura sp. NBRC 104425]GLZ13998.1 hypothetical protein Acsp04_42330 [Actinomadura sp. NBRC 104425]
MPRSQAGGVVWRKSSYSLPTQSDCVEVARVGAVNAVRDSKDPEGAFLIVTRSAWSGLLSQIKQGAYDL